MHLARAVAVVLTMSALIACGIAPAKSGSPGASASPSSPSLDDLAILACPGSGSQLALAEPGQRMLVTGRSADGAFLRVYVPGPAVNEGWAQAAALEVDGDVAGLPTAACGGPTEPQTEEDAADFRVVANPDNPPEPLGPPPSDQLIQLVSFEKDAPPPAFGDPAPWWSSAAIPRVPLISQFDGGPLQASNAVPAAGAMLARLAFGIVATGSQLRALDPDGEGATSLGSLVAALSDRWGYRLSAGYLSSDDLRRLLASGAGAVIVVDYGVLPQEERQQAGFTGDHAMYVDGLRLSADGVPAYYVMDPMGLAWEGYHGEWWPADIVDRAATQFGGRRIVAAWAFAGGVNPAAPPSGAGPLSAPIGDDPSPNVPEGLDQLLAADASGGGFQIEPRLGVCVEPPVPDYCPAGLPAVYRPPASGLDTVPPSGGAPIDLLYADVPQPGLQRVIFSAPPGVEPTFSYWPADGSGPVLRAEPEAATLGGKQVWMVTVPISQAGETIYLMPTSSQSGVVSATEVGQISFGN